ncbi:sialin-like [Paramacrobiotus metropolitanus]|uniref:sialin-like n=1 Tax=Paramacrobiotus metropolitanus TaxID=2943436 RepID=UPI002445C52B|nr:sialin-like [Paramacrobiotus metropolitanus]
MQNVVLDTRISDQRTMLDRKEISIKGARCCSFFPLRYMFAVVAFLGMFNLYALRVNLSVAIVAMVNHTSIAGKRNETISSQIGTVCPVPAGSQHKAVSNGEFNWDGPVQGLVLGSFFYGYIFTCFLGGWLAHKFGGKYIFGPSVLVGGILTLLTPLAARTHYGALIAVRALQGLVNGVCFPAMQTLISSWSPATERTKLVGFVFSGMHIGMVLTLAVSGYLANFWGWASIFYLFGVSACIWFVLWIFFVYDTPFVHPYISEDELQLITKDTRKKSNEKVPDFPWRSALTSLPFLAAAVAHFGGTWAFFTLLTNLPTYLNNMLHFDLEANGLLSALPYLTVALCTQASSVISDWLRQKGHLSTTTVRKGSQLLGLVVPSLCLIGVGFTCNSYIAMALLVVGVGLGGMAFAAVSANFIDLSPQYAGILLGISQTPAMLPGIVAPYVVGVITGGPNGQTMENWRTVFYITASIGIFAAIVYCIFGSGEVQSWGQRKASLIPDAVDFKSKPEGVAWVHRRPSRISASNSEDRISVKEI